MIKQTISLILAIGILAIGLIGEASASNTTSWLQRMYDSGHASYINIPFPTSNVQTSLITLNKSISVDSDKIYDLLVKNDTIYVLAGNNVETHIFAYDFFTHLLVRDINLTSLNAISGKLRCSQLLLLENEPAGWLTCLNGSDKWEIIKINTDTGALMKELYRGMIVNIPTYATSPPPSHFENQNWTLDRGASYMTYADGTIFFGLDSGISYDSDDYILGFNASTGNFTNYMVRHQWEAHGIDAIVVRDNILVARDNWHFGVNNGAYTLYFNTLRAWQRGYQDTATWESGSSSLSETYPVIPADYTKNGVKYFSVTHAVFNETGGSVNAVTHANTELSCDGVSLFGGLEYADGLYRLQFPQSNNTIWHNTTYHPLTEQVTTLGSNELVLVDTSTSPNRIIVVNKSNSALLYNYSISQTLANYKQQIIPYKNVVSGTDVYNLFAIYNDMRLLIFSSTGLGYCDNDTDCYTDNKYCEYSIGLCTAKKSTGLSCTHDWQCASDWCENISGNATCYNANINLSVLRSNESLNITWTKYNGTGFTTYAIMQGNSTSRLTKPKALVGYCTTCWTGYMFSDINSNSATDVYNSSKYYYRIEVRNSSGSRIGASPIVVPQFLGYANGYSCTNSSECASGYCVNNVCSAIQGANGENCTTDNDCQSLFCNLSTNTCGANVHQFTLSVSVLQTGNYLEWTNVARLDSMVQYYQIFINGIYNEYLSYHTTCGSNLTSCTALDLNVTKATNYTYQIKAFGLNGSQVVLLHWTNIVSVSTKECYNHSDCGSEGSCYNNVCYSGATFFCNAIESINSSGQINVNVSWLRYPASWGWWFSYKTFDDSSGVNNLVPDSMITIRDTVSFADYGRRRTNLGSDYYVSMNVGRQINYTCTVYWDFSEQIRNYTDVILQGCTLNKTGERACPIDYGCNPSTHLCEAGKCDLDSDCEVGYSCQPSTHMCVERSCNNFNCTSGYYCDSLDYEVPQCEALKLDGGVCMNGTECLSGLCTSVVTPSYNCTREEIMTLPICDFIGHLGSTCKWDFKCHSIGYCYSTSNGCTNHENCSADQYCSEENSGTQGTCLPDVNIGELCSLNESCKGYESNLSYCKGNVYKTCVAFGVECNAVTGCSNASKFCNVSDGKCYTRKGDGTTCKYDYECASGLACFGHYPYDANLTLATCKNTNIDCSYNIDSSGIVSLAADLYCHIYQAGIIFPDGDFKHSETTNSLELGKLERYRANNKALRLNISNEVFTFCQLGSSTLNYSANKCYPKKINGQQCEQNYQCRSDSCISSETGMRVCAGSQIIICSSDSQCPSGQICVNGTCILAPYTPCINDYPDCGTSGKYWCDADGICQPDTCDPSQKDSSMSCHSSSRGVPKYCEASGWCMFRKSDEYGCSHGYECVSGNCEQGICKMVACSTNAQCVSLFGDGYYCDSGTCKYTGFTITIDANNGMDYDIDSQPYAGTSWDFVQTCDLKDNNYNLSSSIAALYSYNKGDGFVSLNDKYETAIIQSINLCPITWDMQKFTVSFKGLNKNNVESPIVQKKIVVLKEGTKILDFEQLNETQFRITSTPRPVLCTYKMGNDTEWTNISVSYSSNFTFVSHDPVTAAKDIYVHCKDYYGYIMEKSYKNRFRFSQWIGDVRLTYVQSIMIFFFVVFLLPEIYHYLTTGEIRLPRIPKLKKKSGNTDDGAD